MAIVVTITAPNPHAYEDGRTGTFRLTRTGGTSGDLAVNLWPLWNNTVYDDDYEEGPITGAVIPDGQASVDITVTPIMDIYYEGTERLRLEVRPGAGYTVGSPSIALVTIYDMLYAQWLEVRVYHGSRNTDALDGKEIKVTATVEDSPVQLRTPHAPAFADELIFTIQEYEYYYWEPGGPGWRHGFRAPVVADCAPAQHGKEIIFACEVVSRPGVKGSGEAIVNCEVT